jgi:hypothetical protein
MDLRRRQKECISCDIALIGQDYKASDSVIDTELADLSSLWRSRRARTGR